MIPTDEAVPPNNDVLQDIYSSDENESEVSISRVGRLFKPKDPSNPRGLIA